MTTCTITFSAVDTALQVKPTSTLIFEPTPRVIRGAGAQVMTPDTQRVVSDASGAGSIALVPGTYRLTLDTSGGSRQVDITVPSTPTALLGDLIDTPLGEYEFSALQQLRVDVTEAAGQVALDRGAVLADRTLTETARAAAVAAAPVAVGAAAEALVYRDQVAIYAGLLGADMTLEWPDQVLLDGRWDTGLRFPVTNALTGGTVQLSVISTWQVASLFAGGFAPAWFDFSTTAREFQDLLGTPVTAAGQSVGMVRDAITLLTFGPNLVANGDFANGLTGWGGTGWTPSGGAAVKTTGTASSLTQPIALTAGRTYRISGIATVTAGTLTPRLIGGATVIGSAVTASGPFERYISAGAGNTTLDLLANAAFAGSIDNVRVEEVPGIVILQPNFGARGTWASAPVTGRRNRVIRSEPTAEQLTSSAGVTTAATPIAGFAASVQFGNNTSNRFAYQGVPSGTYAAGATVAVSVFVQMDDNSLPVVGGAATGDMSLVVGGVIVAAPTVSNIGGGIYRISGSAVVPTADQQNSGVIKYTTQSARGFRVAGWQIEVGATVTAHQRVTSTHDVSEAGISSAGFVRIDGSDDALPLVLPAPVAIGDLIVATRGGIWREPFSGSSVTLGPTGTPGTASIAGGLFSEPEFRDIVAAGVVQDMSADEWLRLRRWLQARGAPGELVAGPNLLTNGDGSNGVVGWASDPAAPASVSNVGGLLRVTAPAPFGAVTQVVPTEIGSLYLLRGTFAGAGSPYLAASVPGRASPYTFNSGAGMLFRTVASNAVTVRLNMGIAGTGDFDNITLQKLTLVA